MTATMNTMDVRDIEARYPELLTRSFWQRYRTAFAAAAVIAYFIFCWWFFAIGHVISSANSDIAGNYLADWISWEARPDIDIHADGTMKIVFGKYSPLGADPHPDWIEAKTETVTRTIEASPSEAPAQPKQSTSSFSFVQPEFRGDGETSKTAGTEPTTVTEEVVTEAHIMMNSSSWIDLSKDKVELTRGGETLTLTTGGKTMTYDGALPEWAYQRAPGEKIIAYFGFAGRVEVEPDRVKVRKRFLGWENFFFDTNSPFFGKSAGDVISLMFSDNRVDPNQSNLSRAIDDILYNPSWQHLDVWTKLLQTIVMAFVGTLFAMVIAFPLSFLAARNITRNKPLNQLVKRFFDFQRSVDMLIWALFFTRAFGPGPLAGIAAIFFTDTGTLGKLYSEALENIDDKPREGIRSVGASPVAIQRFGVVPQVLPVFVSQALYFWESNTRSATIIGAVGAGGIGLKLWEAMRTNQDWENVAYMVLLILIVVYVFDNISNRLRSMLIGNGRK
ncbi:phosphonate ABC transporter, permease protein PhnE [Rhizobium sp. L1K21]|uniref:phosphonate ABC transporter, permease protein PhnE n=1 Tax=Rhizobium sp. L1K21 TaxID=2954933 RepID=UPI00209313CC|nr:phosphonate ABC transporter, permease protein PhnE [Rhizobium sp. L1K21]MCO6184635.1 phosphonate ABC transporter, permease protein PhnE [Rhizobium sp. L1K21]